MNTYDSGSCCKTGGSADSLSDVIELDSGPSMEGFMTVLNSTLQKMEKMNRATAEFANKDSDISVFSPLI